MDESQLDDAQRRYARRIYRRMRRMDEANDHVSLEGLCEAIAWAGYHVNSSAEAEAAWGDYAEACAEAEGWSLAIPPGSLFVEILEAQD